MRAKIKFSREHKNNLRNLRDKKILNMYIKYPGILENPKLKRLTWAVNILHLFVSQ